MTKHMCSGGENSLPVGMFLPGLQNGKSDSSHKVLGAHWVAAWHQ